MDRNLLSPELQEALASLEYSISGQISMFAYDNDIEIESIRIKETLLDALFNNYNKKSFMVEIIIK